MHVKTLKTMTATKDEGASDRMMDTEKGGIGLRNQATGKATGGAAIGETGGATGAVGEPQLGQAQLGGIVPAAMGNVPIPV